MSEAAASTVPLKDGPIKAKAPDPQFPDIYVQGQIRKRNTHYVVTLFLVNAQEELRPKDEYHIFQPKLVASGVDGQAIFCKRTTLGSNNDLEERLMAMLYRHHVEFAVGHGVSVHAEVAKDSPDRAVSIETVIVPTYEVPRTTPPTEADADENPAFGKLAGLVLDMKVLAEADAKTLPKQLEPLVTAYRDWIDREEAKLNDPKEGLSQFGDAGRVAIDNCRFTLKRIEDGLELLTKDSKAFEAFQFMNRAMWLQRTHSHLRRAGSPGRAARLRQGHRRAGEPQLATVPDCLHPAQPAGRHEARSPRTWRGPEALADLLFFPTGGGKTEAYLGLSAYTMGLRRLQGTVAGRDGDEGVAVLMRYTLRLLTIQQFQRATALICACESIRRKALEHGDNRWGKTPFRIGLWVGRRTTPNRTDDAVEAIKQARGNQFVGGGIGTPYQLTTCPWCGSAIEAGQTSGCQALSPRLRPHADLLRRQVRPVPLQQAPSGGRRAAGRRGGRGDLSPSADAAHRHGGQVRPDAVEGRSADALWAGQRLLRAPRVQVAGDRRLDLPPEIEAGAACGQDRWNTRRSVRPI